ncbi:MAG: hypothetical protein FJW37_07765 [Acidobacteria bacterium]|nr:hypothetical protein [Acidobacteriota bacterium]
MRTNETIETTTTGGAYSAEIARPIVGGAGRVLVPQGSPAQLTVLRADAPGITGGEVTLGLKSIAVAGNTYMVSSATTAEGDRGLGANRRTGIFLGGGATLV